MLYKGLKKYEKYFILPQAAQYSEPSWFGFPLTIREGTGFNRKEIVDFLEKNKIATRMLFGGNLVKQPAYKNVKYKVFGSLKNSDTILNDLFWIGVYPGLTKEMTEFVLDRFNIFLKHKTSKNS